MLDAIRYMCVETLNALNTRLWKITVAKNPIGNNRTESVIHKYHKILLRLNHNELMHFQPPHRSSVLIEIDADREN